MSVIETKGLYKIFNEDTIPVHAVDGIDTHFEKGEFTAVVGPSGCGKTTFLNMVGGIDTPTRGNAIVDGTDLSTLSTSQLTDFRLHNIGFVFQSYNLIPVLSAFENIEFILELQGVDKKTRRARAQELLDAMGIGDRGNYMPAQLSGGQQQRVAVARAIASKPKFILADEPTANLDSKSTENLLDLMLEMNQKEDITFIFSTHDQRVVDRARRIIHMEDGKIKDNEYRT